VKIFFTAEAQSTQRNKNLFAAGMSKNKKSSAKLLSFFMIYKYFFSATFASLR
jgi:hypothetical protein